MDLLQRARIRRLTRAVFDGSNEGDSGGPSTTTLRVLPSAPALATIVLALLLVTAAGLWRTLGTVEPTEDSPSGGSSGTAQSSDRDHSTGTTIAAPIEKGAPRDPPLTVKSQVVVHVSGAVASPGVVTLPQGARVHEAVEACGGMTGDADQSSVNLARALVDGEQVHVARAEEAPAGHRADESFVGSQATCIDLNTASALELEELDGVGPALAGRIVAHREANGPFTALADLDAVSGVGPVLLARIGEGACQI